MRKLVFAYAKTKTQISCAVTAQLISAFVFSTPTVQFLFFLNPKFQASSHFLWVYNLVCADLVGNPEDRFSHNEAQFTFVTSECSLRIKFISIFFPILSSEKPSVHELSGHCP